MFDIITFGSATRDNFLILKKDNYKILRNEGSAFKKTICFPLGSKIEIEDLKVFTGGGGTNTAATFSRQGFKVAYVGKVGQDKRGEAVIDELKKLKVDNKFVKKDKEIPTALSVILSLPEENRTILIYRGACHFFKEKEVPWKKLKARWFYLAPLSGETAKLFLPLVKFAKKRGIKIAANLGNTQINLGLKVLKPIISQTDILLLNREEASLLTKIPCQDEKRVLKRLNELVGGIFVITKGKKGAVVSNGKYVWRAGVFPVKVVEKTGAGDAFGAGFVSGWIRSESIPYAIQLGASNAASCIQKIGAKEGLLEKDKHPFSINAKVKKTKVLK